MDGLYFPNLEAELARINMSKVELAKSIGMAITTIYGKFKGDSKWTLKDMERIRDVLQNVSGEELSLDYLFKAQPKAEK